MPQSMVAKQCILQTCFCKGIYKTINGKVNFMQRKDILLVYDRQCPACNAYCQLVRIRKSAGDLRIIDARENTEVMNEITAQGLDIDQGMVLKMGEQLYYGADAIHALALIGSRSGVLNRLNYWVFKTKTISKILYPLLRAFRNLLLKMLKKTKINNLKDKNNDKS
jgi:predicted DCC family thiol-disulfide oxidoreductase YuxK